MGRLRPGWSVERATAHLQTISPTLFRETASPRLDPEQIEAYRTFRLEAVPRGGGFSSLRTRYEAPLWLLLGLSALVLIVACANLANLLLARAGARAREMAVRLATGASRGRIVRQLLSESLLLASIGTLLGAMLARVVSASLVSFLSTGRDPLSVPIALDWRVLGFAAATAVATTLLFGLAPALRATAAPLASVMRTNSRGLTANGGRSGWQRALVVAQVALSLVMVLVALLFTLSLRNLTGVDPGFNVDSLVVTDIDFGGLAVPADRRLRLQRELLDGVRSIPGVTAAAQVSMVPFGGWSARDEVRLEGRPQHQLAASMNDISARYFETMRTPLVAGRDFDDRDTSGSPTVVIVNQTFARRYLGGTPAIGQRIQMRTGPRQWSSAEIVGLVNDTTYVDLREPFQPIVYRAAAQELDPGMDLRVVLRSGLSLASVRSTVTTIATRRNPGITVSFRAFPAMVHESLLRDWLMATLSGFFGVLALLLASIGLYGVMAYTVASRRNEIGIRLALGADRRSIIRMVLREAIVLVAVGLGLGAVLATMASRAAQAMLFGLAPADPLALVAAGAMLATTGFAATIIPALRAGRLQPTSALRED
jgi:predicted permease